MWGTESSLGVPGKCPVLVTETLKAEAVLTGKTGDAEHREHKEEPEKEGSAYGAGAGCRGRGGTANKDRIG